MRNRSPNHSTDRTSGRRGSVLVVVIVCLGFAATVLFGALRTSLQQRRQLRNEHDSMQTEWLVDGGVRFAMQKLAQDKSFEGQTIKFTDGLRDGQVGVVKITVSDTGDSNEGRTVQVNATLQRPGGSFDMQRSHSFNFP